MGLFSNSPKDLFVMVCPECKEAFFTNGKPQSCGKCSSPLYLLTNKKLIQSQWKEMRIEDQKQYIADVICAVHQTDAQPTEKSMEEINYEKFITTTNTFENQEIEEYLGTVSGTDIYLIGGLMGGGLANQENLFGTAFKNAKKLMFNKAQQLGGNAVVGMNLQLSDSGTTGHMVVVVTGTAVKLKSDK